MDISEEIEKLQNAHTSIAAQDTVKSGHALRIEDEGSIIKLEVLAPRTFVGKRIAEITKEAAIHFEETEITAHGKVKDFGFVNGDSHSWRIECYVGREIIKGMTEKFNSERIR